MAVKRFAGTCLLLASLPAAGQGNEPLYAKNLSPVSGLFGLPSQRFAGTGPAGALDINLHTSIANNYVAEFRGDEQVNLDGETLRMALEFRYALADNWDLQLEVPWLDHSGGFLDATIDGWHDFWGMSDGGRSRVERDLLDFSYAGPDARFVLLDDASGVGDSTLTLSWQFARDDIFAASVAAGYKFATGDEDDFLGSGEDDGYLVVRFSGDHRNNDVPLRWHGQAGYLYAGESDLLGKAQEQDLWFVGLTMDWVLNPRWSLIGQLDAHAAPMNSEITSLGDEAIMLTAGVRWRFAPAWAVDFSVVEDVQVETAPDVTFQASLRYRVN
ncbi:hypothetical protein BST95_05720 [Halioglobus japonicus]|uniref:DUF3187 domain-containing protein n=1 Tax=Halioglobus japonicus TaxID=930805 RepID=A0AAP8MDG6_9GAMM|nr:DUF3187 family protein [Halioglobus japonicus]AQA17805.1 hypothetical protein BST95_05720 [Halioglobus japonicus]PLW85761.1 DUF3187 domain-containing protein [Halioglobus japonicus]GHD17371.1 hypothetical protein GCM10007052_23780 [Halioglobus japonicus]